MSVVELLIGVVFVLCVGIGFGMTPAASSVGEFWAARACFIFASIALCAAYFWWLHQEKRAVIPKAILGTVVVVLSIVCTGGGIFWVNSRELSLQPPDITLRFVNPQFPALVLVNKSNVVAEKIIYDVALWDRDQPDQVNKLPIPSGGIDWLKPGQEIAPRALFYLPSVTQLLKPGTRLMGSASVSCPTCLKYRTYIISIDLGKGAWFTEINVNKSLGGLPAPDSPTAAALIAYINALDSIPMQIRIPVTEKSDYVAIPANAK